MIRKVEPARNSTNIIMIFILILLNIVLIILILISGGQTLNIQTFNCGFRRWWKIW